MIDAEFRKRFLTNTDETVDIFAKVLSQEKFIMLRL